MSSSSSSFETKKTKLRKRFGPPRGGDLKKLTLPPMFVPPEQQYTDREKVILAGINWRALICLVVVPVMGAGLIVYLNPEFRDEIKKEKANEKMLRPQEWYKKRVEERRRIRDEKKAKRLEEEKAKQEAELYELEKQQQQQQQLLIQHQEHQDYEQELLAVEGFGTEEQDGDGNDGKIAKGDGLKETSHSG
jgi:uncharacterized protein HemX